MFGWIKIRKRNELLKLLRQNFLAYSYFENMEELAEKIGFEGEIFAKENFQLCRDLWIKFENENILSPDDIETALDLNRNARSYYDSYRKKQNAFRSHFGGKLIEPNFDEKFMPILGWKRFYESYWE